MIDHSLDTHGCCGGADRVGFAQTVCCALKNSAQGKQSVKSVIHSQYSSTMSSAPALYALPATPLRVRVGVVALVLVIHAVPGLIWMMQPVLPKIVVNEMSVSIAMQQAETAKPQALLPPQPRPQTKLERTDKPVSRPVLREVAEAAPHAAPSEVAPPAVTALPVVAAAPVVDSEPDYKASYLNNPRPAYPMVARRMGWEGRVILNVEVLTDGACGGVNMLRSSGHEVLDNAAMATVKSWRFTPARHAGRIVTQWFKVPIVFLLEDNEA